MVTRPPSFLLSVAAAVVALLCLAPASATRAESHPTTLRSSFHRYAHAHRHRCGEASLSRPIADDEGDDGIADDDAALHVSRSAATFSIADPSIGIVPAAPNVPPASGHTKCGAPRAPPRDVSA